MFPPIRPFFRNTFPHRRRSRAGAALLLVLGFVVLLSFLTIEILKNAQREILWQAEEHARPQSEIAARAALESVLAVIANFQTIDGAIYAPEQGWNDALSLAGFTYVPAENAWRFDEKTLVSVKFTDESGRFPINELSASEFADLLLAIDVPANEIDSLYDCLKDWTDADDNSRANGAEIDDYESENAAAIPPNRKLRDLRELRSIHRFKELFFDGNGNPNSLFRSLENVVSLRASSGKPNINTASAETLAVLCHETDVDEKTLLDYKSGEHSLEKTPRIFRNAEDLSRVGAESLANKVSFRIRTLRITITARRGNASFVLDTLAEISARRGRDNAVPFKITRQKANALYE